MIMTLQHKLARLKQKLPHGSLASYIGVDNRTLGRWLSARNQPLPIFQKIIHELYDKAFNYPGMYKKTRLR